MIEENPDSHHRGSAGGDRCVHEDDSEVFDVFRETQIVQLGLTSIGARLKHSKITFLIRFKERGVVDSTNSFTSKSYICIFQLLCINRIETSHKIELLIV